MRPPDALPQDAVDDRDDVARLLPDPVPVVST